MHCILHNGCVYVLGVLQAVDGIVICGLHCSMYWRGVVKEHCSIVLNGITLFKCFCVMERNNS